MVKTIVVTGCSSGFGRQVSERLARAGNRVYATMRDAEGKNTTVAGEILAVASAEGLELRVLDLDVTSPPCWPSPARLTS
ncbi:MAG: SDR family NAD(P)-dependent oxidoreductase [Acidobacteria bacterium]|nr:SDR family NAD(P)-dependent oxidoreductase [Acidobacteriota bacterium]